jgi:hypothetical protein
VQRGIKDGFAGFNGELMLAVLDPDLKCHADFQLNLGLEPLFSSILEIG